MKSFFYNNAPDKLLGALFSFKRFFILVISLLIFVQCTKEIEFDFEPDTEPTIVLNCIFQPNSPISLHVSKTGSILEPLLPVDDTFRLKLFENSMLRVDTSFFGSEFKSELFVNPGSTYSLKLDSKEYNEIYSSDTLPELVNIRDAFVVFPAGIDSYGDYLAEANIEFNDPAEVSNYYELLIFSGEKNLSYWTSYHDINITDPVLINEGDIDYHPQSLFLVMSYSMAQLMS